MSSMLSAAYSTPSTLPFGALSSLFSPLVPLCAEGAEMRESDVFSAQAEKNAAEIHLVTLIKIAAILFTIFLPFSFCRR